MKQKFLIFDSGPLISLSMTGMLYILEKLKTAHPEIIFILPAAVKRETIDKAARIKKYELESVKLSNLLDKKVLQLSSEFIPNNKIQQQTAYFMQLADSLFSAGGEKIKPIQEGEASCLAFSKLCNAENLIVVDERTTRLLTESPASLHKILERKLHTKLLFNNSKIKEFQNFRFIRSSELLFQVYQENLFDMKKNKQLLDALLYAAKFSGAAISSKEIEEAKQLI